MLSIVKGVCLRLYKFFTTLLYVEFCLWRCFFWISNLGEGTKEQKILFDTSVNNCRE